MMATKPDLSFSFDEVMKEIESLNHNNPDGFTVRQMSEELGKCKEWCREKLRDLIDSGKAQYVGKRQIIDICGKRSYMPIYSMVKK